MRNQTNCAARWIEAERSAAKGLQNKE